MQPTPGEDVDQSPSEIWEGDLFNRQNEAQLMIGYIESIVDREFQREDARSYTIAIDAPYGEGKSFFLRRLAKQLQHNHPVAFVDAWTDDLADEPLTALASTLKRALAPLIEDTGDTHDQWNSLVGKIGKVTKIVALGLAKKGAGLLITEGATNTLTAVLGSDAEEEKAIDTQMEGAGKTAVDDATKGFREMSSSDVMNEKIKVFDAGQKAIEEMKDGLEALISSLDGANLVAPIVIVIDELDRCRPTYAVKLLEEIKHLFDVPGLVFIFGMNGTQLGHSLAGAYGSNFDGNSYLKRFINRRYRLSTPDLTQLVESALEQTGFDPSRFIFPTIWDKQNSAYEPDPAKFIAKCMDVYGLAARDVFQVADKLQTCAGLTGSNELLTGYLLPLILNQISGRELESFDDACARLNSWGIAAESQSEKPNSRLSIKMFFIALKKYSNMSLDELNSHFNARDAGGVDVIWMVHYTKRTTKDGNHLADPANYDELIETVGRFANPRIFRTVNYLREILNIPETGVFELDAT